MGKSNEFLLGHHRRNERSARSGKQIGVLEVLAYLAATVVPRIRSGEWSARVVVVLLAALASAFVLVNLAYLLPRLAYAPRINLSLGYGEINEIARQDLGRAPPFPGPSWVVASRSSNPSWCSAPTATSLRRSPAGPSDA